MNKAVILLNMGAPNNLDEVELFLKNMFNDENIITVKNRLLRKFIAFMIVASRKKVAKENYKQIGGKSPLLENTERLIKKLQEKDSSTYITYAMRYTPPFSKDVIAKLKQKDIKKVFLLPLYPQYSTTTTKSSIEEFIDEANKASLKAKITYTKRFYKEKGFNLVIISQIKKEIEGLDISKMDLIFSAHSLPQKIVDRGDSYQKEIEEHVQILSDMLKEKGIIFNNIHLAYQSKLGPIKWIGPSLEEKLETITSKNVLVYPISFLLDNSETIQELHIEYANIAKKLGYANYKVCKCLNDDDDFAKFLYKYFTSI